MGMVAGVRIAEPFGEPGQHGVEYARIDGGRRLVIEIDRRWPIAGSRSASTHAASCSRYAARVLARPYRSRQAARKCPISASLLSGPRLTRMALPATASS